MKTLKVWKVVVAEKGSLAKDYWMVPAKTLGDAVAKASRETAKNWELESALLVEGDFIFPTMRKTAGG